MANYCLQGQLFPGRAAVLQAARMAAPARQLALARAIARETHSAGYGHECGGGCRDFSQEMTLRDSCPTCPDTLGH